MTGPSGDRTVEEALADIARQDPQLAECAQSGWDSLTWGEGLDNVTAFTLADYLWYQLPAKSMHNLNRKLQIARGLGALFTRLGMHRYASVCLSDTTVRVLTAYEQQGRAAGLKACRAALDRSGVLPPDIPGVLEWSSVMGEEETAAFFSTSIALEQAMDSSALRPGSRGWRGRARQIATKFLDGQRDELTGSTRLQWVHTERLQRWAESRGPTRAQLTGRLVDQLTSPLPAPQDTVRHLAPVIWLLEAAHAEAPLTATGNLTRPVVAEGCSRFGWHIGTGQPRSEADIPELRTVRELATQMRAVRRTGRRLLLSEAGRSVLAGGDDRRWQAAVGCLAGPGDAEAAAAEIALMIMSTGGPSDYQAMNTTVARAMAEEGWRGHRDTATVTSEQAAVLLGSLRRRLRLLDLQTSTTLAGPLQLNDAGRLAAHTALRAHAVRPRTHPAD